MKPLLYIFLFAQITLRAQLNIDAVLNDYKKDNDLKHASYGLCVIDLKTKKIIKEYNSDLALIPASTLKIVTTGAALGILKKDFTYKTNYSIIYKGDSIKSSDIIGLKIIGSGDPSFNSNYFYNNDSLFFSGIIKKLKSTGIDIDLQATQQAKENVAESKFRDQIKIIHSSLQSYSHSSDSKYQLIVSNPPFFEQSFKSKESAETLTNPEDKAIKSKWIYTHSSPKLEKIIFYTNTKSNNHYAESLLKTVGAIKTSKQGTTQNGIDAIKKYWENRGIDVSGLNMTDGSGLSRANTITTKIQAEILSVIFTDSLMYESFNNSLPIAVKNGSMTNLCKGTFAENNMRAKTGYINRARGYCGYVKTKSGKNLAFSVLFNNFDCSPKEMKLKIEKLLVSLVEL